MAFKRLLVGTQGAFFVGKIITRGEKDVDQAQR
jgi:hypothetical protein